MNDKIKKIYLMISSTLVFIITLGIIFAAMLPIFTISAEAISKNENYAKGSFTKGIVPAEADFGIFSLINYIGYIEYVSHVTTIQDWEGDIRALDDSIDSINANKTKYTADLLEDILSATSESEREELQARYDELAKTYDDQIDEKNKEKEEVSKKITEKTKEFGDKDKKLTELFNEPAFLDALFFSYGNSLLMDLGGDHYEIKNTIGYNSSALTVLIGILGALGFFAFIIISLICLPGAIVCTIIRLVRYIKGMINPSKETVYKLTPRFLPMILTTLLAIALLKTMGSEDASVSIGVGFIVLAVLAIAAYTVRGVTYLLFDTECKTSDVVKTALSFLSVVFLTVIMFTFAANIRIPTQMYKNAPDFINGEYYQETLEELEAQEVESAQTKAKNITIKAFNDSLLPAIIFELFAIMFLCVFLYTMLLFLGGKSKYKNVGKGDFISTAVVILIVSLVPAIFFSASTNEEYEKFEKEGVVKLLFDDHEDEETTDFLDYTVLYNIINEGKEKLAQLEKSVAAASGAEKELLEREMNNAERNIAGLEHKLNYMGTSENDATVLMTTLSAILTVLSIAFAVLAKKLDLWLPCSLLPTPKEEAPENEPEQEPQGCDA